MQRLYDALKEYGQADYVPMHMPGHKRRLMEFDNPYSFDITEIDGFDNLHHAEGILKEAQEFAAKVCRADETHFLINGSTGGLLSAVFSATEQGGSLLMARNCHKAVYHAAELRQLQTHYLYPQILEGGIPGGITVGMVRDAIAEFPDSKALVITSPTYDGIVSDVEGIVKEAHTHGVSVIVDEAHGAHFLEESGFPKSAVRCGADVVIQSTHKTLPALTQTALLHVSRDYCFGEKLRKYLSIFQTSSPSYVLMASIDACMHWYADEGREAYRAYRSRLLKLRADLTEQLHYLKLLTPENVFDYDSSKLVIYTGNSQLSGEELHRLLLEKYHIQVEMASAQYVLCMTGAADSDAFYERLLGALLEIDGTLKERPAQEKKELPETEPEAVCTIAEAVGKKKRAVPLFESRDKVSAAYIYLYPPGIPILTPGEKISAESLCRIDFYLKSGLEVQGLTKKQEIEILWEEFFI